MNKQEMEMLIKGYKEEIHVLNDKLIRKENDYKQLQTFSDMRQEIINQLIAIEVVLIEKGLFKDVYREAMKRMTPNVTMFESTISVISPIVEEIRQEERKKYEELCRKRKEEFEPIIRKMIEEIVNG